MKDCQDQYDSLNFSLGHRKEMYPNRSWGSTWKRDYQLNLISESVIQII